MMKNIKYLLFLVVALFMTTISVNAATITSAKYDGNVKIEGTGSGQIQIVLFNLNNEPIYMTTTETENGKFSITLPKINGLSNGKYNVKVADYDGTNIDTEPVTVKITTPNTVDNINVYIIIGVISVLSLCTIVFIKNKKCND